MEIKTLGIVSLSIIFIYGIKTVCEFYGMNISSYGIYISFYLFLLLSYFILN